MTADTPEKFLFDNDFDEQDAKRKVDATPDEETGADASADAERAVSEGDVEGVETPEAGEEEAPPPPTFSEEDLERAREEGRAAGRDEATKDMAGAIEQRTAETLDAIKTQVANLFDTYVQDQEQRSRDAVAVAAVIVRKLFPALNMDKAMAEIEHMITEAMKRTSGNPQLIVRVAPDMAEDVETRAAEIAALRGREGTLNIIGDGDMASGDARVEWEGGGMVRDNAFIWREIDEIIERNLGQKVEMPPETAPDASRGANEAKVENPAPVGENEQTPAESAQTAAAGPETQDIDTTDADPAIDAGAPSDETPDGERSEDDAPRD